MTEPFHEVRATWRTMGNRLASQAGETLIELLLAIAIIMIAVTAVLGALVTSVSASGQHRSLAAIDTLLKSYAESAKYQIELQSGPRYQDCATASTYASLAWTYPPGYTSGYSVGVTNVEPWDVTSKQFDTAHSGACTNGLQRLTIVATGPTGATDTLQIVVRNPAFNPANAVL